jgi:hypothetical protein
MALTNIADAWGSDETSVVFKRFLAACLVAASNVLNEAGNTPNHANRLIWANAMLSNDPASVNARVRQHVRHAAATNATFQADPVNIDDGSVQFIVNSQIDLFATGS